jgi:hypothetical protein
MPKLTRAQIEAQIAELQGQLDTADTDDEVWVKDERGREFKVAGRRATSLLGRLGLLDDDGEDDSDESDDPDEDGASGKKDPKPGGGGYFAKRRK